MIPPDVASRLRLVTPEVPTAPQPAAVAQQVADALSDLVPGQRVLAQIQTLLPNGMYRAVVGQRDVTLALPFSAKPGDSLELEVVESEGRVSLAFVANRGDAGDAEGNQSVATRLSQAGRLISDLLTGVGEGGKRPQPAPLNGNLPVVARMPDTGTELVPMLKDALVKSGMFYESHQARWVEGKLPQEILFQQPQGKHSPVLQHGPSATGTPATAPSTDGAATVATASTEAVARGVATTMAPQVAPDLAPLVQQQLDALASQSYVWQGQIWPGQPMHWEITEQGDHPSSGQEDAPERWQTHLNLRLPRLGGVAATIRLRPGNEVEIAMTADAEATRGALTQASDTLRTQLDAAGLKLAGWTVGHGDAT